MRCVRCDSDSASRVAVAPDGSNAWEVYYCNLCNFSWRSTEEPEVIDHNKRDSWFQLNQEDIEKIPALSPVPPLKK